MTKMIQIEPSIRQSDEKPITIEASLWREMCEAGRKQGFAVGSETTLGPIEAKLFAAAVRRAMSTKKPAQGMRGSDRFTSAGPSVLEEQDVKVTVDKVLALLEAGGVVLNSRVW